MSARCISVMWLALKRYHILPFGVKRPPTTFRCRHIISVPRLLSMPLGRQAGKVTIEWPARELVLSHRLRVAKYPNRDDLPRTMQQVRGPG